jgi:glucokinase
MRLLGLDIGGTSVKAAFLEGNHVLHQGHSGRYRMPDQTALLAAVRQATGGWGAVMAGCGVCVPGLLDPVAGVVQRAVNVPGLVGIDLRDLVAQALDLPRPRVPPLTLTTDARAAAHDLWSTRRPNGRLLVLSLGTGVGAAVLDEGVPLRVDGDSPGHFGQLDVTLPDCPAVIGPDGGAGGLEGYVGAAAIEACWGQDAASAAGQFRGQEPAVQALVRAVRIAHAIYRPQHVVLAGGVGIALGHLIPDLRAAIADRLTSLARPGWTLTVGEDGYHAARGAARLAGGGR